jgi:hypothetical protein
MGYGNRIISNTVTSAPKSLPVTVEEMKTYMNQPFSEDDTLIEGMITAARQYVESKCNISIGQQEHKVVMATDGDARFLPSQPLVSLDEVKWTNCDCMAFEDEQRGDSSWSVPAWIKEQMKQYTRKSWV